MINELVFDIFPVLETERLVLRAFQEHDAEDMFRIYSDKEAMRFWGSPPMTAIDEARQKIDRILDDFRAHQGIRWAFSLKGQQRMIGSGGFWRLMKQHKRAEIGYELAPEYWGQGLVPEAFTAILTFGFEQLGLHSVEAQIDPANHASRRVLEKLGFVQEGYFRENYCVDGRFTDTAVFSLLHDTWQRRRSPIG